MLTCSPILQGLPPLVPQEASDIVAVFLEHCTFWMLKAVLLSPPSTKTGRKARNIDKHFIWGELVWFRSPNMIGYVLQRWYGMVPAGSSNEVLQSGGWGDVSCDGRRVTRRGAREQPSDDAGSVINCLPGQNIILAAPVR